MNQNETQTPEVRLEALAEYLRLFFPDQRGLPSDPDAHKHPHSNPYRTQVNADAEGSSE